MIVTDTQRDRLTGCVPIRGSVRVGTDLGIYEWDDVPNAQNHTDWEACCKLCGLTDKCQTWESNPEFGCILKHGTPEEERSHIKADVVVSGKRPSTGIPYESGLHRPTKLFVASHPDDDALFFGEHLTDGYHKDSFNVRVFFFSDFCELLRDMRCYFLRFEEPFGNGTALFSALRWEYGCGRHFFTGVDGGNSHFTVCM